jgi:hypothetical protein
MLIGVLKELGFLDADGTPQRRYFEFLDQSRSGKVLADGIREAYRDLFAVNREAHEMSAQEVTNKLRTMYEGKKSDLVIKRITGTFKALCDEADFTTVPAIEAAPKGEPKAQPKEETPKEDEHKQRQEFGSGGVSPRVKVDSLQYHINIVLPESRDVAVYDAIFKSLKEHLG